MLSILNANYNDEYKILLEFSDHKKGEVTIVFHPLVNINWILCSH